MSFHDYSKNIVEDYLGTVAYVDDLIYSSKITPVTTTTTISPSRESVAQAAITGPKVSQEKQVDPNIDPRVLTNSFSEKGIHCALLELNEEKSNIESIKKTLKKSDVIILDWQMHSDNGQSTRDLIEYLLTENKDIHLSLRLIVIYTDQPAFNTIIHEHIAPIFERLSFVHTENSEVELQSGHTKVLILPKSNLNNQEDDKITGSDLPEKIIEEMTKLTSGLVSNYALQSVLSIRKNTHKLLGIYNKDLDPGYLSHKMLLPDPQDSKEQIYELIGSEIKSIIKSKSNDDKEIDILDIYFKDRYAEYNTDFIIEGKETFTIELPVTLSGDDLMNITNTGIEKYFLKKSDPQDEKVRFTKTCHKSATEHFISNKALAKDINCKFSRLTTLKSFTTSDKKYLDLGTIVLEDVKNGDYFLCIQPKCDSVRISQKSREFLFIKLIVGRDKNFDLITPKNEFLKIDYTIYYSSKLELTNIVNGKVESIYENDQYKFIKQNKQKLIWIGELKNDFAQYVANQFAAQLARVAVDHYEWLRRS